MLFVSTHCCCTQCKQSMNKLGRWIGSHKHLDRFCGDRAGQALCGCAALWNQLPHNCLLRAMDGWRDRWTGWMDGWKASQKLTTMSFNICNSLTRLKKPCSKVRGYDHWKRLGDKKRESVQLLQRILLEKMAQSHQIWMQN